MFKVLLKQMQYIVFLCLLLYLIGFHTAMAFIEPLHHNKANITYLLTYLLMYS